MTSWRSAENAAPRPVKIEVAIPITASTTPASPRLATTAPAPLRTKNGSTGSHPRPRGARGADPPKDQARVGEGPVVAPHPRRSERITADAAVAALEFRECRTDGAAAGRTLQDRRHDAGMRALGAREPAG